MEELVIGDTKYISSKRAAEITGYAKDYVGQLCREGRVEARLVGRSWYVREASIRDHRFGPSEEKKEVVVEEIVYATGPRKDEIIEDVPSVEGGGDSGSEVRETVTLMQDAWQEWFTKNKAGGLEEETKEEIVEHTISIEEPEAVAIQIQALEEKEKPHSPVQFASFDIPNQVMKGPLESVSQEMPQEATIVREVVIDSRRGKKSYLGLKLSLGLISIIVILATVAGSGLFILPIQGTPAAVIDFLSGTNVYQK